VAVSRGAPSYLEIPPFHPHVSYPEYPFGYKTSPAPNPAYASIRTCFYLLGLDREHFDSPGWNPLSTLIQPGEKVVIKPNFVVSRHYRSGDLFAIITHPSVLRAVIDYVYKALGGNGKITIADCPQMDCDFGELIRETSLQTIIDLYKREKNFPIEVLDLRTFWITDPTKPAYSDSRVRLLGDPSGGVLFNLGTQSHFYGVEPSDIFFGADYDRKETIKRHHGDVHEYLISKTVMESDVVVLVPKLKVHKKVGVTLNMKGLVGMTTDKNCLVHYRLGRPSEGGDQIPDTVSGGDRFFVRIQRYLYDTCLSRQDRIGDKLYELAALIHRHAVKPFFKVSEETRDLDSGNWHGNDTAWRMVADLLKIFLYGDTEGRIQNTVKRKIFCVVDGIIGGEGNGPLLPDSKLSGCLLAGYNPVAVDLVATRLMGLDYRKIKQFSVLDENRGFDFGIRSLADIDIVSNDAEISQLFKTQSACLNFRPPSGWRGHIEI
jgi:uncharacterized protein (DUF362 family)